ncbi:hypothetical protein JMM81_12375 [Bacillus sp. V3B]|nr:hypothetical protein [Bacillus sp. V3B]
MRPIKAIRDDRFTVEQSMIDRVEKAVDSSLKIAITVKLSDLQASGYNKNHPDEGDVIILVEDRFDMKVDTRIVEIVELLDKDGNVLDCDVTLSNFSNIFEQQRRIHNATKTIADAIEGKRPLPFEALAIAVQQATIALQNAQTELEFPDNGGILAIDKTNPNKLVLFNSAGIGISDDGGQTFKTAMTGDGIVADIITVGTMLANRIKGGILTLGGTDNGNGRMIVLNEDGEVVADLDAVNGGFNRLYVGDLSSPSVYNVNRDNLYYTVSKNGGISEVLNNVPWLNNATVKLTLSANITEDVEISNFLGNGNIIIDLNGYKLDGSIFIVGNSPQYINIYGGTINSKHPDYIIRVDRCTYVRLETLKLYGNDVAQSGIYSHSGSAVYIENSEMYDVVNSAISSGSSAQVTVRNCKGMSNNIGVHAFYGGVIYITGSIPGRQNVDMQEVSGEILGTATVDYGAAHGAATVIGYRMINVLNRVTGVMVGKLVFGFSRTTSRLH